MALNRAFTFQIMACDANFMSCVFSPIVNLADLGLMAVKAITVDIRLVFPMLEGEDHYPHLEVNDFRTQIFWNFCKNNRRGSGDGQYRNNEENESFHNMNSFRF
jgi:hypothetical protein